MSHGLVRHQVGGWDQALDELDRYFERAAASPDPAPDRVEITAELGAMMPGNVRVPEEVIQHVGWYVDAVLRLGRRTADLHLALAGDAETEAFAPVPLTRAAWCAWPAAPPSKRRACSRR